MDAFKVLSPLHKAVRQIDIHLEPISRSMHLSHAEAHLLTFLLSYAPCPISELGRVFGVKRSTLTSMLDRLEKRAFIVRQIRPEDRRSWLVVPTAEGRRTARKIRKTLEAFEAEVLHRAAARDLKGFHQVLALIARITEVEVRERR
jgi:DNA-binding MarR family transcriptional regulator